MMKLHRRHRVAKSENDREYLIENNTKHEYSKVLITKSFFELTCNVFRYVEWHGNLPKVHGKLLKLVLKQRLLVNPSLLPLNQQQ